MFEAGKLFRISNQMFYASGFFRFRRIIFSYYQTFAAATIAEEALSQERTNRGIDRRKFVLPPTLCLFKLQGESRVRWGLLHLDSCLPCFVCWCFQCGFGPRPGNR